MPCSRQSSYLIYCMPKCLDLLLAWITFFKEYFEIYVSQSLVQKKTGAFNTPVLSVFIWQGRRESNTQPSVLETDALPIELLPCVC